MKNSLELNGNNKSKFTTVNVVYFTFCILYLIWVLTTYRNIIHMDMVRIVSTKVRHLFEHKLTANDFIYQPLFPTTISLVFTYINASFFHLNTTIESVAGTLFLFLLGYKYLSRTSALLSTNKQKVLFSVLISFIIFGLHKWEASFTSFFSFAVFFTLCICFFNYFFVIDYISTNGVPKKRSSILFFLLTNMMIIIEAPAYFYGFILSVISILLLIKIFKPFEINKKNLKNLLASSFALFVMTIIVTSYLAKDPRFSQYATNMSIGKFVEFFLANPIWVIKFYLIAHTGPFLGEAYNHPTLRAAFGLFILIGYGLAVYHVFKSKDKRLVIPVALIFYNLFSYVFITMGRYIFNAIDYGASSRYTAYNMCGVIGLVTILFFIIAENRQLFIKWLSVIYLGIIIVGYLNLDIRQLKVSPYRTAGFRQMKEALLTGNNLGVLQADSVVSLSAIEVLRKYQLNVYYENAQVKKKDIVKLTASENYILTVESEAFDETEKTGFYTSENGIAWTNGTATLSFKNLMETTNKVSIELFTYMPPICKNISPKLSLLDENGKQYSPNQQARNGDTFTYSFDSIQSVKIARVKIISDTIDAAPDMRKLSFPFKGIKMQGQ